MSPFRGDLIQPPRKMIPLLQALIQAPASATPFWRSVFRFYDAPWPTADAAEAEWHAFRLSQGVAESGADYALNDAFPHDVLLDQLDGIGFKKGCFIGQEVVSRMQHRGTARRRVLLVEADSPLPAQGTELTVDGRPVGTLGSVSGRHGLAIARIDRVKTAMDAGQQISADGVALSLAIPGWARFAFPEQPVRKTPDGGPCRRSATRLAAHAVGAAARPARPLTARR